MASVLIIVVSAILLAYWFRCTCLIILSTRSAKDYASGVAVEKRLSFPGVEQRLATSAASDLRSLEMELHRDYQVVTQLLKQAGRLSVAGGSVEELMLQVDFWVLKACCGVSTRFSEAKAREALAEMCQVVGHLANTYGERAAAVPTSK